MGNSVIPESMGFLATPRDTLSQKEQDIMEHVLDNWPTSALEIADHFNEVIETREQKKQLSTKYTYYLKKLVEKRLLLSKRVGNALIVWPLRVEKYRTVHNILAGDDW